MQMVKMHGFWYCDMDLAWGIMQEKQKAGKSMRDIEMRFLDEYKRLDNICGDMYSCKNGVSEYLVQMEQTPERDKTRIASWDDDYRILKRLRWLRNYITHETTPSDCNEDDFETLLSFHNRILCQQDPLSLLHREKQKINQQSMHQQAHYQRADEKMLIMSDTPFNHSTGIKTHKLLSAIVFVLVLLAIVLFFLEKN